jgi:hypothetical protein
MVLVRGADTPSEREWNPIAKAAGEVQVACVGEEMVAATVPVVEDP